MPTVERPPLRTHQRRALEALDEAWAGGRTRAWTVLPPGAGKTRVGLETAERLLAAGQVERAVVLGPNTAIVGQWEEQAADLGIAMTAWTYQSVAVFDPDAEVDEDGDERSPVARLHENGRARVEELRAAGPLHGGQALRQAAVRPAHHAGQRLVLLLQGEDLRAAHAPRWVHGPAVPLRLPLSYRPSSSSRSIRSSIFW